MWEFIQANWLWILLGVSFLFMFRMHGAGGCGMGHGSHGGGHRREDESSNETDAADHTGHGSSATMSAGDADHDSIGSAVPVGHAGDGSTSKPPAGHRRGGC